MVIRLIIGRSGDPVVRMERCKLLAGGCQLIAIGVLAAAIVVPIFNPALHPGFRTRVGGGAAAAVIELLALRIMGYVSVSPSSGNQAWPNFSAGFWSPAARSPSSSWRGCMSRAAGSAFRTAGSRARPLVAAALWEHDA